MMDLMYFGYEWEDDSASLEQEFISDVKKVFPNVILKNAHDSIKGYRQEVWLDDSEEDNFNSFLFGKQWYEFSLTIQIAMMSREEKPNIVKWINLAKKQYPEAFKPEALINLD
jgi:hypothetical protein